MHHIWTLVLALLDISCLYFSLTISSFVLLWFCYAQYQQLISRTQSNALVTVFSCWLYPFTFCVSVSFRKKKKIQKIWNKVKSCIKGNYSPNFLKKSSSNGHFDFTQILTAMTSNVLSFQLKENVCGIPLVPLKLSFVTPVLGIKQPNNPQFSANLSSLAFLGDSPGGAPKAVQSHDIVAIIRITFYRVSGEMKLNNDCAEYITWEWEQHKAGFYLQQLQYPRPRCPVCVAL